MILWPRYPCLDLASSVATKLTENYDLVAQTDSDASKSYDSTNVAESVGRNDSDTFVARCAECSVARYPS